MNILILAPDGSGSTILQRLLTITLHIESIEVVNADLSNGLYLDNNLIAENFEQVYSQRLFEVENFKKTNKSRHIISKLNKYDFNNISADLRSKFFNFFYEKKIISTRNNIFEYALSSSIRQQSGISNIYNIKDKIKSMSVLSVDEDHFLLKCNDYVNFVNWMRDSFPHAEQISYEDVLTNTDYVIEKITGYKNTFFKKFGMDLSSLIRIEHEFFNTTKIKNGVLSSRTKKEKKALSLYKTFVNQLVEKKIIPDYPIKNNTLQDKKKQIKNFDKCLDKFYSFAKNHNWIDQSIATYDYWHKKHI